MVRKFMQIAEYTCELSCIRYAIFKLTGTYRTEEELIQKHNFGTFDDRKDGIYDAIANEHGLEIETANGLTIREIYEKYKNEDVVPIIGWQYGANSYHGVVLEKIENQTVIVMNPERWDRSDFRIYSIDDMENLRSQKNDDGSSKIGVCEHKIIKKRTPDSDQK